MTNGEPGRNKEGEGGDVVVRTLDPRQTLRDLIDGRNDFRATGEEEWKKLWQEEITRKEEELGQLEESLGNLPKGRHDFRDKMEQEIQELQTEIKSMQEDEGGAKERQIREKEFERQITELREQGVKPVRERLKLSEEAREDCQRLERHDNDLRTMAEPIVRQLLNRGREAVKGGREFREYKNASTAYLNELTKIFLNILAQSDEEIERFGVGFHELNEGVLWDRGEATVAIGVRDGYSKERQYGAAGAVLGGIVGLERGTTRPPHVSVLEKLDLIGGKDMAIKARRLINLAGLYYELLGQIEPELAQGIVSWSEELTEQVRDDRGSSSWPEIKPGQEFSPLIPKDATEEQKKYLTETFEYDRQRVEDSVTEIATQQMKYYEDQITKLGLDVNKYRRELDSYSGMKDRIDQLSKQPEDAQTQTKPVPKKNVLGRLFGGRDSQSSKQPETPRDPEQVRKEIEELRRQIANLAIYEYLKGVNVEKWEGVIKDRERQINKFQKGISKIAQGLEKFEKLQEEKMFA